MTMGHNSLTHIADRAIAGLKKVGKGRASEEAGWLEYGAALNEGRALFPEDDKGFGKWKKELLDQVGLVKPKSNEEGAAMWAAANPEQVQQAKDLGGKTSTLRGLHKAWKEEYDPTPPKPAPEPEEITDEDLEKPVEDPMPTTNIEALRKLEKGNKTPGRYTSIFTTIRDTGTRGITRDELCALDFEWAANKHIDQYLAPLMRDELIYVRGGFYRTFSNAVGPEVTDEQLTKTDKTKVERAIRQRTKHIDDEVYARSQKQLEQWQERYGFKSLEARLKVLEVQVQSDKHKLSEADYKKLLKFLHPDRHGGSEEANHLFQAVKAAELQVHKPSDLPSIHEIREAMEKAERERAAKKARRKAS